MKKILIGMAIGIMLVVAFFALAEEEWLKNLMGDFLGYGTCPNCGDNWLWKDCDEIRYGDSETLKDFPVTVIGQVANLKILEVKVEHGVMICKECLASPAKLNEEKIAQDLLNSGWPPENVKSVKETINRYKKEKLNNK